MGHGLPNRSEFFVVGYGVESQIGASHGRVDTGVIDKEVDSEYKYPGGLDLEVNKGRHERPTQKYICPTLGESPGELSITIADDRAEKATVVKPSQTVAKHGTRATKWTSGR